MKFNDFLIKKNDGNPSVTMTAFVLGFVVVNIKLLISGMTIGGLSMAVFSGVEYAAAVAALGTVYVLRRSTSDTTKKEE